MNTIMGREEKERIERAFDLAFDYVKNVTNKQERLLDDGDLWLGYDSVISNGDYNKLTEEGFMLVLKSIKERLKTK